MNAKLTVQDISKTFRIKRADQGDEFLNVLRNVSFEIGKGEIVSVIGESGCGKTTLLRIIQGLTRRDSGILKVDGKEVSQPSRDRGFVFQQASLLPWRNAKDNVAFGLELQGADRSKRERVANDLLDLVGLNGFSEQYPHQLSGGMQQRVGLARALAINPEILLMDEPFSALDAQTREVLQRELLRIHSEIDLTVMFVTHDLDEAIYLADRIVVLAAHPGRVKEIIEVPFPRPREDLPLLRGDPVFQDIRVRMWELIRRSEPAAA